MNPYKSKYICMCSAIQTDVCKKDNAIILVI